MARAWIAADRVRPVNGGTATSCLPVETVTLMVAPNATVVLAAGSCWTIVPSGWSLLLMNWVGTRRRPLFVAVVLASVRSEPTKFGTITWDPGVDVPVINLKIRKPATTRIARPSSPATQAHGLVPEGPGSSSPAS